MTFRAVSLTEKLAFYRLAIDGHIGNLQRAVPIGVFGIGQQAEVQAIQRVLLGVGDQHPGTALDGVVGVIHRQIKVVLRRACHRLDIKGYRGQQGCLLLRQAAFGDDRAFQPVNRPVDIYQVQLSGFIFPK